jgi:glutamate N-acetyltransferase/amino-acid N-acetyltransferase
VGIAFASGKGEITVCEKGTGIAFDEAKAKEVLSDTEITIKINMGMGTAEAKAYGCDLTYDYVKINGDYRS